MKDKINILNDPIIYVYRRVPAKADDRYRMVDIIWVAIFARHSIYSVPNAATIVVQLIRVYSHNNDSQHNQSLKKYNNDDLNFSFRKIYIYDLLV